MRQSSKAVDCHLLDEGTVRYKYALELPASLEETAVRLAKADGVSLNQWITAAVAQKIGSVQTAEEFLVRRAAKAKPGDLGRYLDRAPDAQPSPGDQLSDT